MTVDTPRRVCVHTAAPIASYNQVRRYRPGQVPKWVQQGSDDDDHAHIAAVEVDGDALQKTDVEAPVIIARPDDPRLARLAQQTQRYDMQVVCIVLMIQEQSHITCRGRRRRRDDSDDEDEDAQAAPKAPRIVRPGAQQASAEPEEQGVEEEEEDEEELELRRAALRARCGHAFFKNVFCKSRVVPDVVCQLPYPCRLKAKAAEEEAAVEQPQVQEEEEEEEEESSEYETDSEEEEHMLMKPVFVPKTDREVCDQVLLAMPIGMMCILSFELCASCLCLLSVLIRCVQTIVEREALEHEYEIQQEKAKQRAEERKVETRQLVVEIINAEATAMSTAAEEVKTAMDLVVTDDEEGDADEEFEAWKAREMARIKRSREEAKKEEEEEAERQRWKALTDEEKAAEKAKDAEVGFCCRCVHTMDHRCVHTMDHRCVHITSCATQAAAGKKKWRFMQKYWHKGAFFQDDADDAFASSSKLDVLERDYSAPTGEDKLDRSLLPQVMQVKNFGRRGQTKWTHLKNEDTTDFNAPWAQDPNLVRVVLFDT